VIVDGCRGAGASALLSIERCPQAAEHSINFIRAAVDGLEVLFRQEVLSPGDKRLRNQLKDGARPNLNKASELVFELLDGPSAILEDTETTDRRI
jgi:hypothetical protein